MDALAPLVCPVSGQASLSLVPFMLFFVLKREACVTQPALSATAQTDTRHYVQPLVPKADIGVCSTALCPAILASACSAGRGRQPCSPS